MKWPPKSVAKWANKYFPRWFARYQDRLLRRVFRPLIEKAEREKNRQKVEHLHLEWSFERRLIWEPIEEEDCRRLTRRAAKFHIYVDELDPPGEKESHWVDDGYAKVLHRKTNRELRRRLEKAGRERGKERREAWAFWFGLIVGLGGILIGLASVLKD